MRLKRFSRLCAKWQKRLRLADWALEIKEQDPGELPIAVRDGFELAAATAIDYPYSQATVSLNPKEPEHDDEAVACHEMLHCVLSPLLEVGNQMLDRLPPHEKEGFDRWLISANERVTSHLERVFMQEG